MARIVLATFGSYGDLYPYVAVGKRLAERGHSVVVAASETYRDLVEGAGLELAPTRPEVDFGDAETIRRVMDPRRGAEVVVREVLVPFVRESYRDLEAACEGADLLTSHVLTYAGPILGAKRGLPWLSTVLMPMAFCSAHDPPALPPVLWLARLRPLGPRFVGGLWSLMKRVSWSWSAPIRALREELGLEASADPLWEGQYSPHGTLALFSRELAEPQPDWPQRTTQCGFPFHDEDFGGNGDDPELARFLADGPPPLVFSLGSSAVYAAGDFYDVAVEAASRLGRRAVVVVGRASVSAELPDGVLAVRSAELSSLFAASSAVVHAGGVGTTGQAMRAGRPQLLVPVAHDQFDNARHLERLDIGRSISKRKLAPARLARALEPLLGDETLRARAEAKGEAVRAEDGAGTASDAIERVLEGALS